MPSGVVPPPAAAPAPTRGRRAFGKDPRELAAVFIGGAIGAGIRAGLGATFPASPGHWPWVTFGVNIAGAILLGYFTTRLQERLPFTPYRRPLLGTGLCGGLTTFSTMQVEAVRLIRAHAVTLAVCYLAASIAAGLVAVHLTTHLVRRVRVRPV